MIWSKSNLCGTVSRYFCPLLGGQFHAAIPLNKTVSRIERSQPVLIDLKDKEWFRASIRKFLDDIEQLDRKILGIIAHDFGGGPVGAKTIAISVGEEVRTIEEVYEPYLIQIGFIKQTPQGM